MIGLAGALMLMAIQEPQAQPVESRHWTNGQLAWSRMPRPDFPARETGTVQAEVTCTVADRGRVQDCRILRVTPDETRFGRGLIRSLGAARLAEGSARAGDTMTFILWACGPDFEVELCRKIDWPSPE